MSEASQQWAFTNTNEQRNSKTNSRTRQTVSSSSSSSSSGSSSSSSSGSSSSSSSSRVCWLVVVGVDVTSRYLDWLASRVFQAGN